MSDLDLQEIHDYLIQLAHEAADLILSAKPETGTSGSKKNSSDLVTETDKAVETHISTSLRQRYPSCAFMGEETWKPGDHLTGAPTFVVDPIDGTTNFVHFWPYVCISLGFAVGGVPVVGVVYNPFTRTLYSGVAGRGSYLTTADGARTALPLKGGPGARALEPLESLQQALVAVEWGSDRSGTDFEVKQKLYARLARSKEEGGAMVHSLRSLGSAALNLCAVAEGSLDVYWEAGCWPWDVCAGWVVLKEAGGTIVDGQPGGWDVEVDTRRYLAVRKGTAKAVIEEFWSCIEGQVSYSK